jgi:winged helix DNA-binding protein
MNNSNLVQQRLHNHKLSSSNLKHPADVVRWLGAVQAQDFGAAKWAIGLRMRNATSAAIDDAFNEGQILRTHLLRPTWHFVTPEDIRWLLELTAPRVNLRSAPNYRKYELDGPTFKRSNKILTKALKGGKHLTRSELKAALNRSGVAADDVVRLAHILLRAELDGVVCSGPRVGKQFSYTLLDERVPPAKRLTRDEAIATLTQRYFTSHGPATVQDFIWWSGLTAGDARKGLDLIAAEVDRETIDEKIYYIANRRPIPASTPELSAHLLPAYDEYNVAYKERHVVLDACEGITTWDMLGPTISINGKITGTWKPTINKAGVVVSMHPARKLKKAESLALANALDRYARFLNLSDVTIQ